MDEEIEARWEEAYTKLALLAAQEGSYADTVLSAGAYMLQDATEAVQAARYACHVSTALGSDLDSHGEDYAITRKEGTLSGGVAIFTGEAGTEIPENTPIVCDGLIYYTDVSGIVGAEIPFTAAEAGSDYNKAKDSVFVLLSGIGGVTGITLADDVLGGSDIETDDAYRGRLLDRLQNPQLTGTVSWYESLAESVPGVGKASCIPVWDGAGTVKICCADPDGNPITDELAEQVAQVIADIEYIGPEVTVEAAKRFDIAIAATISGACDVDALEESLKTYFASKSLPKTGTTETISCARIVQMIMEMDGVTDCTALTINGEMKSVQLSDGETPVLTALEVTVNA